MPYIGKNVPSEIAMEAAQPDECHKAFDAWQASIGGTGERLPELEWECFRAGWDAAMDGCLRAIREGFEESRGGAK